eukprot:TRINITY_DN7975_c0_g1_i10.p1 TRINITY_DN7975_c0_g1~~TRINITY_DN7975_c0_g1_i10.p1  ORF type:complete len:2203 (+),score=340.71 TRINITY_DN7975_c0_g1_i10:827-6610(+)
MDIQILKSDGTHHQRAQFGVCDQSYYYSYLSAGLTTAWSYIAGNGQKCNSYPETYTGKTWGKDDIVGCEIDLDVGTIEFFVNGESQGIAYSNLKNVPVVFAFCCVDPTIVAISTRGTSSKKSGDLSSKLRWIDRNLLSHLDETSIVWHAHNFRDGGFTGLPPKLEQSISVSELDTYITQFMWVVLRCCHSKQIPELLARSQWFSILLTMTQPSQSKIKQILALRIARFLLPLIQPNDPRIPSKGKSVGMSFLESFIDRIGAAYVHVKSLEERKEREVKNAPQDTESSVASELVALLRVLLRNESWSKLLHMILLERLQRITSVHPKVKETAEEWIKDDKLQSGEDDSHTHLESKFAANLEQIVGAMAIIGSTLEPHREGARVIAEVEGEVIGGVVVKIHTEINKATGTAKATTYTIQRDDGDLWETTDKTKLDFTSDVSIQMEQLPKAMVIVESLAGFIKDSQDALPTSPERTVPGLLLLERIRAQLRTQSFKALLTLLAPNPRLAIMLIEKGFGPLVTDFALQTTPTVSGVDAPTIYNLEQRSRALEREIGKAEEAEVEAGLLFGWPYGNKPPFDQEFKDENGILYFIGTRGYTKPWENPMEMGEVTVTMSTMKEDSAAPSSIVGRTPVKCATLEGKEPTDEKEKKKEKGEWVIIDFKKRMVRPSHYTLRHYDASDYDALRNWVLDASEDGKNWETLVTHKETANITKKSQSYTWEIPKNVVNNNFYQQFRVQMTGVNSNNRRFLALSGFEIYGNIMINDDIIKRPKKKIAEEEKTAKATEKKDTDEQMLGSSGVCGHLVSCGGSSYSLPDFTGTSKTVTEYQDTEKITPVPFDGEPIVDVSGWYYSAMACTKSGKLWTWGYNSYGQLGTNDTASVPIPKCISIEGGKRVILVSAGYEHNLFLTDSGEIYGMGYNGYGQTGVNTTEAVRVPTKVTGVDGKRFTTLCSGGYHGLAATNRGELYVWGQGDYGQLGMTPKETKKQPTLHPLVGQSWAHFACGMYHSMGLTREGKVYSWGDGYSTSYPCTGHNPPGLCAAPKIIDTLDSKTVVQISCHQYSSMALTKDGEVYTWGYGGSYRLGFSDSGTKFVPTLLNLNMQSGDKAAVIHMGVSHGQIISEKGDIYTFGSGGYQHGTRDYYSSYPTPTRVTTMQAFPTGKFPVWMGSGQGVMWYITTPKGPPTCPIRPLLRPSAQPVQTSGVPPYPEGAFLIGSPDNYRIKEAYEVVTTTTTGSSGATSTTTTSRSTSSVSSTTTETQTSEEIKVKDFKLTNYTIPKPHEDEASALFPTDGKYSVGAQEHGLVLDGRQGVSVKIPNWNNSKANHDLKSEHTLLYFFKNKIPAATELKDISVVIKKDAAVAKPVNEDWTCAACTLRNKAISTTCEACGTAKPAGAATGATGATPTVATTIATVVKAEDPKDTKDEKATPKKETQTLFEFRAGDFVYSLTSKAPMTNFTLTAQRPGETKQTTDFTSSVFKDDKYHTILCVYGVLKPTTDIRQLVVYFDGESVGSIDLGATWPYLLPTPEKGARDVSLLVGEGMEGCIKEIAYWQYALEGKNLTSAQGGIGYVLSDWSGDQQHKDLSTLYEFPKMERKLREEIEAVGPVDFEPEKKDEKDSADVLSIPAGSYLKVAHGLPLPLNAKAFNTYTVTFDVYLPQLPEGRQALFSSTIKPPSSAASTSSTSTTTTTSTTSTVTSPTTPAPGGTTPATTTTIEKETSDIYVDSTGLVLARGAPLSINSRALRMSPQVWHRVAISFDQVKAMELRLFVDGVMSSRFRTSAMALDTRFTLFQDEAKRCMLPIKIRQLQIRSDALNLQQIIVAGNIERNPQIPTGRALSEYITSLVSFGYKGIFCEKAVQETNLDRRRAYDWLLKHAAELEEQDQKAQLTKLAENLSLIGFPLSTCVEAIKEIGRAVQQECRDRSRMPSSA